ncbi:MAG TPA: hypothetical protein VNA28_05455 [Solirubrobacteraceae bacterium]|nr:hypothetical protein [Solirubrobacteraceae bacterium]
MSAIPGEPLKQKPHELILKDGTKLKLKFPGMPPRMEPLATEERGPAEPPRDNPAPAHNPNHGF